MHEARLALSGALAVTCLAPLRLRIDSITDFCFVTLDQEALGRLVGGVPRIIVADFRTVFVTGSDESQGVNEHAMQVALRYGVDEPLFGDVLVFGYDGRHLHDAPEATMAMWT